MPPIARQLIPELTGLAPSLIIFDKDGTLIDFHTMWRSWITELARRLETATGQAIDGQLFKALDFDPASEKIASWGKLALAPMSEIRALTIEVVRKLGLSPGVLEAAMAAAWHNPDPALAQPVTDLTVLFSALRAHGIKTAVATSDDRSPTRSTLAGLGLDSLVDTLVCGDDGLPIKPAPDMVLTICRTLNISPAKTVVVGDNVVDLQMGRSAGVGLVVGVLSGLAPGSALAPHADLLLPSVEGLLSVKSSPF